MNEYRNDPYTHQERERSSTTREKSPERQAIKKERRKKTYTPLTPEQEEQLRQYQMISHAEVNAEYQRQKQLKKIERERKRNQRKERELKEIERKENDVKKSDKSESWKRELEPEKEKNDCEKSELSEKEK